MPRKKAPSPEGLRLYRVLPWTEVAGTREPGHPLYVPRFQRTGRIDNPGRYSVLYLGDSPVVAVAEAFANHATWTSAIFEVPQQPTARRALATFDAGGIDVLDLDASQALLARELRPSDVVTRDRERTRRWALAAHEERRWDGIRWWNSDDPDHGVYGLWSVETLVVRNVEPLRIDHPAVIKAARMLNRVVESA